MDIKYMGFKNCFLYLVFIGIAFFFIGRILPHKWFCATRYPYKCFAFEKGGKIYERIKIKKWQNKLIDMSKIFPFLMPAKKIEADYKQKLPVMIKETCIAEFIHTVESFFGLYCIRLWPDGGGAVISILFFAFNIPFIIIQRYNRPRLIRLRNKGQNR